MKKTLYTAQTFSLREDFKRRLRKGVMIAFMFTATVASASSVDSYDVENNVVNTETIARIPTKSTQTNGIISVELLADSYPEFKTVQAFDRLITRLPEALSMEPVMRFVTEGIGNIDAERVVMDCDTENEVLNVSYKLRDNMLLSISKPLETMNDQFVMFNVYHGRDLLVSDSASIELLSEYIHNVENRIKELA
ncbi:MAG: hypothetical protein J6S89_08150 [Paludibacteraceae bacterium]|nr:hypothetical protein [Paludibacteraceae bacterium]MBP5664538.1 hypothetical protein [Bacteroidales bacterium]